MVNTDSQDLIRAVKLTYLRFTLAQTLGDVERHERLQLLGLRFILAQILRDVELGSLSVALGFALTRIPRDVERGAEHLPSSSSNGIFRDVERGVEHSSTTTITT